MPKTEDAAKALVARKLSAFNEPVDTTGKRFLLVTGSGPIDNYQTIAAGDLAALYDVDPDECVETPQIETRPKPIDPLKPLIPLPYIPGWTAEQYRESLLSQKIEKYRHYYRMRRQLAMHRTRRSHALGDHVKAEVVERGVQRIEHSWPEFRDAYGRGEGA